MFVKCHETGCNIYLPAGWSRLFDYSDLVLQQILHCFDFVYVVVDASRKFTRDMRYSNAWFNRGTCN